MAEPEENQEKTTVVHEATPDQEPPPETHDEKPKAAPQADHQEEEKKKQEVPTTAEEKEKLPEVVEEKRRSSGKRASISEKTKTVPVPVNQESFVPPDAKRPSTMSSERRVSSVGGGKRASLLGERTSRSPSTARKSKFGGLSSKARMVLGSIVDIKTNAAEFFDKKAAKFQNTYKLDSDNPFNPEKVDKILKDVMQEVLESLQYDPEKCASASKFASTQIRNKVKHLEFDRYKLVCIVTIGEKNSQDVCATCRFLWDPEKDRFSFYSLENTHVYAIAYCFGLYYE